MIHIFSRQLKVLGAKVSYYRKLKNYSQLDLGEMCGLSETYICRIENGKATGITLEACNNLAKALDVTMEELVKGDEMV